MINQIITVNHRKYASGLFWQPIGAGAVARNYARNLSRSIDKKYNLFVEYKGMVGLGMGRNGHRVGMPSVAAEVMEALAEYTSFLAVFHADKYYLVVAVRNGIILQDQVYETEAQAREEYVKLSEIPGWGALIAPGVWGMPRAIDKALIDVIGNGTHFNLKTISLVKSRLVSVLIVVSFIFVMLVLFREPLKEMMVPRVQVEQIQPEVLEEYKKQVEEKNKELDVQFEIEKTLPPEPIVMPFENLPDPVQRAQVCYQAIAFLMQPVNGWNQVVATCGESYVDAELKRTFGTIGDFYEQAAKIMPNVLVGEQTEDLLIVQAKLPKVKTYASQDERDAETIVRDVMTMFQSIDTEVQMNIVADSLTNGVDVETVNVVEISADSKMTPMQFMKIFENFGGVYMTRCTWNMVARIWNYEVIIYAK